MTTDGRKTRWWLMLAVCLLAAGCDATVEPEPELERFSFDEPHMGTTFRIVLYAPDEAAAEAAAGAAFERIGQLDDTLSDYDPESELSRFAATSGSGEFIEVSDDLHHMLERSIEFSQATDGAFDITVGPVVRLWRRARRRGERPDEDRLAAAKQTVGYEHIELHREDQAARLTAADMRLDLGGIAKGYAISEALAVLKEHGLGRALVDGGGDVALGDPPPPPPDAPDTSPPSADASPEPPAATEAENATRPEEYGWRVAVMQPLANVDEEQLDEPRYLLGDNLAVATSGDVFQAVEIDGKRYSHIIDPRDGEPTTTPIAVTVIAHDGTTADALASSVSVMGAEQGLPMVEAAGAAAIVTWLNEDGTVERRQSDTLSTYHIVSESALPERDE